MIRKFLLVDDDQEDKDLFKEALHSIDTSIEFYASENAKELISSLRNGEIKPEIIFLDINMPEIDGWDWLSKVKSEVNLKNIPVLMYSTSPVSIDGRKALKKGALAFLEKPTSYIKLKEFLEQITKANTEDLNLQLRQIEAAKTHRLIVS
jgi:CheY-like chemotaxis protein